MLFSDYVRLARRSAVLLLVFALLGVGGALGYSLLQTPQYQSTTTIFVSTQQAANLADLSQGADFAEQLARSYAQTVPTAVVLSPVISSLGLNETSEDLKKQVEVSQPLDTVVLQITVTDDSPTQAAKIANAVVTSLSRTVQTVTPPTADTANAVRLFTLDPAIAPASPSSPRVLLNAAIGLAIGLAIGVFLILARNAVLRQEFERARDEPLVEQWTPGRPRTRSSARRSRSEPTPQARPRPAE